jgi:hypothetical protein
MTVLLLGATATGNTIGDVVVGAIDVPPHPATSIPSVTKIRPTTERESVRIASSTRTRRGNVV